MIIFHSDICLAEVGSTKGRVPLFFMRRNEPCLCQQRYTYLQTCAYHLIYVNNIKNMNLQKANIIKYTANWCCLLALKPSHFNIKNVEATMRSNNNSHCVSWLMDAPDLFVHDFLCSIFNLSIFILAYFCCFYFLTFHTCFFMLLLFYLLFILFSSYSFYFLLFNFSYLLLHASFFQPSNFSCLLLQVTFY